MLGIDANETFWGVACGAQGVGDASAGQGTEGGVQECRHQAASDLQCGSPLMVTLPRFARQRGAPVHNSRALEAGMARAITTPGTGFDQFRESFAAMVQPRSDPRGREFPHGNHQPEANACRTATSRKENGRMQTTTKMTKTEDHTLTKGIPPASCKEGSPQWGK